MDAEAKTALPDLPERRAKKGFNFLTPVCFLTAAILLMVFCESALATSLGYRLALLGYSQKEVDDILSGRQTLALINANYKRQMLGYTDRKPYSHSFAKRGEGKALKDFASKSHIRAKSPLSRQKPFDLSAKKRDLIKAQPYLSIIEGASTRNNIEKALILAVIRVESNFNSRAVSSKGALGLMQLMPGTASDLGVTDPFDPRQNIFGGTRYLSDCIKTCKDLRLALAAYNAGPARVSGLKEIPAIPETQAYVKSIIKYKELYDKLF